MDGDTNSELLLNLLKANLCNSKLIYGLEKAGLAADDYYGDLETVVLTQMGFDLEKRETELYDFYDETMNRLLEIDAKDFRPNLDKLAHELYEALLKRKTIKH